jgi:hydroxymethylpyrimidine pyrophosphatase-like HAD family hydrolase
MPGVDLVVTDLDGTFWHTDDHLPEVVQAAVAELDRRGVPLLVATGRRLASTRGPLARFGLAPPAIMLNGAIGIDLATDRRFHLAPFEVAEALAVYDGFRSVGLSPVTYVDHPAYDVLLSHEPDTNPGHVEALGTTAGRFAAGGAGTADELRAEVARWPVLGYSMIGVPFEPCEAAAAALDGTAEVHLDRAIDFPGMASLTVAPRGQSKWDGVVAFCRDRGLDPGRVLAVADGPNDIELLTNAAIRLVPAVAHEAALELADQVIPAASEGGWAEVLDHLGPPSGRGGGPSLP